MYERFSDRARKVMQLANQEAQRFGKEFIAPEHVLLGLLKEGSGVAANALKNLGVELSTIRKATEDIVGPEPEEGVIMGRLPHTPMTRKVVELAMDEARALDHNYVGTEHILLGLARLAELSDSSAISVVMRALHLTPEKIRDSVKCVLQAKPSPPVFNEIGIPIMAASATANVDHTQWKTLVIGGEGNANASPPRELPKQLFAVGDVVKLKSGGPAMTVMQVFPDGFLNLFAFTESDGSTAIDLRGIDPNAVKAY